MKNFSSLSLNEWNVIIDKIKEMFFIDEDVYAFQKYLLSWFIKKKNTKENRQWFVWLFLLIKFFCRKIYLRMSMRNMTNANTRVSRKIICKKWTQSFFFTYKKGYWWFRPLCDCFINYQDTHFALKRYNHVLSKVYYYIIKNLLYPCNPFVYGNYNYYSINVFFTCVHVN